LNEKHYIGTVYLHVKRASVPVLSQNTLNILKVYKIIGRYSK